PVIGLGDRRASEVQEALGARLTPREQEIFDYVSRGYNNREIASALGTSHFTVRNQLCRLFRKVGVSGRSELVGLAAMATRRARTVGLRSAAPAASRTDAPVREARGPRLLQARVGLVEEADARRAEVGRDRRCPGVLVAALVEAAEDSRAEGLLEGVA